MRKVLVILVIAIAYFICNHAKVEACRTTENRIAVDPEGLLMIKADGESLDFRLVDPQGRIAVIALDHSASEVPGCEAKKSSDDWVEDEEDFDADTSTTPRAPWGGGRFTLENPEPGRWWLEALAVRGCDDSCVVTVYVWSMKSVTLETSTSLRSGQSIRWEIQLAPRDQRARGDWVRLALKSKGRLPRTGGKL